MLGILSVRGGLCPSVYPPAGGGGGTAKTAVLVQNQDHADSLLASLTFMGDPTVVEEVDPSTGAVEPALDDAPSSPGFQIMLEAGGARLLLFPADLDRADRER